MDSSHASTPTGWRRRLGWLARQVRRDLLDAQADQHLQQAPLWGKQ